MGTTTKKSSGKKASAQKKASSSKTSKKSQKRSGGAIAVIIVIVIAVALLYLFGPRETMIHLVYDYTGIVLPEALPWEYRDEVVSETNTTPQVTPQLSGDLPTALEIPLCAHTADSHEVHEYTGFTLCYREQYEQAEWVAYEINTAELVKEASRTDDFRPDSRISTGSATLADCAQYKVALCAEGMEADEIWLIEAKDDTALEKLQQRAQTRIEAKLGEAAYYVPDQYAVIEKAELVVIGRYIALLVSPDVDTLKATFEAAFQ